MRRLVGALIGALTLVGPVQGASLEVVGPSTSCNGLLSIIRAEQQEGGLRAEVTIRRAGPPDGEVSRCVHPYNRVMLLREPQAPSGGARHPANPEWMRRLELIGFGAYIFEAEGKLEPIRFSASVEGDGQYVLLWYLDQGHQPVSALKDDAPFRLLPEPMPMKMPITAAEIFRAME